MPAWIFQLQHWPPGLLVFLGIAGLIGLFVGFSSLRRYRLIEDVPTARVRSAPQGYVELHGRAEAMPGEPIVAPLTQTQCCWFSYRVERRVDKGWRTTQSGTSDGLFLLRDDTGECVIDPEGAEVDSSRSRTWYGSDNSLNLAGMQRLEREFGVGLKVATQVMNRSDTLLDGNSRFTERLILDGDPLYAIGEFHSLDDSDFSDSERLRMVEILREWKARPETLRERFDRNRDGVIDQHEWETARGAAGARAREELSAARRHTHVHMLRKPQDRLYLIANRDEPGLIRRLHWRARIGLGVFGVVLVIEALALAGRHFG